MRERQTKTGANNAPTIKTVIRTYNFYTYNTDELAQYEALKAKLEAQGLKCFESWGGGSHYTPALDGLTIELETTHLFNNQWNTAPIAGQSEKGLRVFDWAQDYMQGARIKRGHYLEQTEEMSEVRRNTSACGYCGKQEPSAKGYIFCPYCLGSEYLEEKQIHLTRMMPVYRSDEPRAELSAAESAHLLPLYKSAQIYGATKRDKARIKRERARIKEKARKTIANARAERNGLLWLMRAGIKTDNVIFYDHRSIFSFGWRSALSEDVARGLETALKGFPYAYELKESKS